MAKVAQYASPTFRLLMVLFPRLAQIMGHLATLNMAALFHIQSTTLAQSNGPALHKKRIMHHNTIAMSYALLAAICRHHYEDSWSMSRARSRTETGL